MSYELVTLLDVSVDTFFFPNKETDKSTQRRQLDSLLDEVSDQGLRIVTATAKLRKSKQRAKHEPEHTTEYGMRNAMSPYGL